MRSLAITGAVLSFAATAFSAVQGNLTKPLSSTLLLADNFSPPPSFVNVNLVHIINLERGYAKETVNVVIENVSEEPQTDYYVPFPSWQMAKIGGFEVKDRKNPQGGLFKVSPAQYDEDSDTQFYVIHLPTPLAPKAQLTLGISYALLSAFTPLPAAIAQKDKQFLVYEFSAISPSTYITTKQKTEVKFPSTNIPEYTILKEENGVPESPQKQGSKFIYGPFDEIPAGAVNPVKVRYEFTKPLIHVSRLERDIEVSHWGGNVAFEERYTLHNRAANLTSQFNRVEYAQSAYYNPPTIALKSLVFPLKVGSLTPYFTDVIGNVSTSRFRSNKREANLEIKPRYPVFGGWNYPFRIGWDADLKKFLRKSVGRTYVLNVPFLEGPKQAEGVEYQHVEVRVILPEGATNLKYSTTVPLTSTTESLHRTFMDTKGRTALTLTAYNIVDDVRDRELFVTYDYPLSAAFRKPIVIFLSMLSLYFTVWAIGQVDTGIKAKKV